MHHQTRRAVAVPAYLSSAKLFQSISSSGYASTFQRFRTSCDPASCGTRGSACRGMRRRASVPVALANRGCGICRDDLRTGLFPLGWSVAAVERPCRLARGTCGDVLVWSRDDDRAPKERRGDVSNGWGRSRTTDQHRPAGVTPTPTSASMASAIPQRIPSINALVSIAGITTSRIGSTNRFQQRAASAAPHRGGAIARPTGSQRSSQAMRPGTPGAAPPLSATFRACSSRARADRPGRRCAC